MDGGQAEEGPWRCRRSARGSLTRVGCGPRATVGGEGRSREKGQQPPLSAGQGKGAGVRVTPHCWPGGRYSLRKACGEGGDREEEAVPGTGGGVAGHVVALATCSAMPVFKLGPRCVLPSFLLALTRARPGEDWPFPEMAQRGVGVLPCPGVGPGLPPCSLGRWTGGVAPSSG